MTCSQVRELAGAYALDALPRHERHQVDRHLDRCARCRRHLGPLSDAASLLAVEGFPPQQPPAESRRRLLEVVAAPARPTPGRPRREPPSPPAAAARTAAGRARSRWVRALPYVAAAIAIFALGWAAARLPQTFSGPAPAGTELERLSFQVEQELWRSLAPPASAVVRLQTDPRLAGRAVGFAAVAGREEGCRLRVVAHGLPSRTGPLMAWVVLEDGTMQPVGKLSPTARGRWELETLVRIPPQRLRSLQLRTEAEPTPPGPAGAPAAGERVMWGGLWAGRGDGDPW